MLLPKMRTQTLVSLLLSWLLLTDTGINYWTTKVQAIESVFSKLRPAQPSSRSRTLHVLSASVQERRNYKAPSGPNPVGNQRPPSKD